MRVRPLFAFLSLLGACTAPGADSSDSVEPKVDRVVTTDDGAPFLVRGSLGRVGAIADLDAATRAFEPLLPELERTLRLPAGSLVAHRVQHDRIGMTHVRFEQRIAGLRVVGGEVVAHVGADGVLRSLTNGARDGSAVSATPRITADEAAAIAIAGTTPGVTAKVTHTELVYQVSSRDGAIRLAWEVSVTGTNALLIDRVYVDAHAAREVDRHPQVFTARKRTTYDGQGQLIFLAVGNSPQVGSESSPPANDAIARAAHDNVGSTYDCYKELYDRDSYDDNGGELVSTVHILFLNLSDFSTTGNNAAWAQDQMVYGDGDDDLMAPLPLAFDVTAHEITHGVTSKTANLVYMNESGALNEGMSDIMAAVCDAWKHGGSSPGTYLIGEEIFTPDTANDALRYMANPTQDKEMYPPELGGSRDFYADRYTGSEDQGGVHLNSGIANLAFYLLAEGGTHPRQKTTFEVPAIGIEKAGAIFERALTQGYFTSNTNFAQAREATLEVANDMFPEAAASVGLAWAAVGVGVADADTVRPTVAIVSPSDGATVAPDVDVSVDASDDKRVVRVELRVDGVAVGSVTNAPYELRATGLTPGSHTLTAMATDGFNEVTDSVTVTVDDECEGGVCGAPAEGDGDEAAGGCCSTGSRGAPGSIALMVGVAALLLRRRRR